MGTPRARAERLVAHPSERAPIMGLRAALLELAAECDEAIVEADGAVRAALVRRRELEERRWSTRKALAGDGEDRWRTFGRRFRQPPLAPSPEPPPDARELRSHEVGAAASAVLRDAGVPLAVADIVRTLRAAGWRVPGRPSQTVSNALRTEVAHERVQRLRRGLYVATQDFRGPVAGS